VACVAEGAQERVTPVLGGLERNVQPGGHTLVQNGTQLETVQGRCPVEAYAGRRALKIHATQAQGGLWYVGISAPGWTKFQLDDYGPQGTLDFDVAGKAAGDVTVGIVESGGGSAKPAGPVAAKVQLSKYIQVKPEWQHVAIPLGDFMAAAPTLNLSSMEKVVLEDSGPAGETTLYVADVVFRTTNPEKTYPPVKVDQEGYPPDWPKVAKVTLPGPLLDGDVFVVKDAGSGAKVLEGRLTVASLNDKTSGDNVYNADFSQVTAPGQYVVEVPGLGQSSKFRIAGDVYDRLTYDVIRFFFFQRCGTELKPENAGPDAHRACHTFDSAIPDPRGGMRDGSGGWHDAGDMNRYVGWTMQSVPLLLLLYRHYPAQFPDGQLNIPESGNGVPDLLDEAKYELDWVRKMLIRQGPDAGMVYDRVHEDMVQQPQGVDFYDKRHGLSDPSDEAACALVADMSLAYVVYKDIPQEKQSAEDCLEDALLSWQYLTTRGRPRDEDFFVAATMLFEATGRDDAHGVVKRLSDGIMKHWIGDLNYGAFNSAVAVYSLSERPEVDKALQARLRQFYQGYADVVVQAARSKGYNEPMIEGVVFSWGSNGHYISRSGMNLLMVNKFAPNPAYVETARDALHWLLGRNAVNQCMVTGHGDPPLGPIYHSMFGPLGPGLPMPPGYLPGGVNSGNCPGISVYTAKCWRPDIACWELTEPSIGYQGPFTYLVGALYAAGKK
jgi:endoglucanase